ncbi:PhzF family phenazine biosynthesis protein [Halioxenophilus aromaticivorans]|uniref:PhzF family phenazine biosynthesis protein n=1 Tax=Halioxenophilus aromaticivorans TaxID=1306992 RepID=A0AAV3TYJ6_9ALTE
MTLSLYQVDAFASRPFSGNPAAVVLLEKPLPDSTLQAIAAENNLSETAYLLPEKNGYGLRWFTPTIEMDLCGHATLASAHVLFSEGIWQKDSVEFFTRSGTLTVKPSSQGYEMDFPLRVGEPCDLPAEVARRLPVTPLHVDKFAEDYLVVVDEATVMDFEQNFIDLPGAGGVILTAQSSGDHDIVSRFFCFRDLGIVEDPVTGSIHCQLASYWGPALAKQALIARQASVRGGELHLQVEGQRVLIRGQAVTYLKGDIVV